MPTAPPAPHHGPAYPGALLIAGTTSDAGKSAVVAGLCRALVRRGISVAPFKAQNMSNNSAVTPDGGEIGRAQALQAEAAGIAAEVDLNPVLLKPGSDRRSQLVLRGHAVRDISARDYHTHRNYLLTEVTASLNRLRERFDIVLCEGAGSPAEINLRSTDIANMGLARAAHLPCLIVGDIDRGGVLAHLAGTVAVLDPDDQALIAGFLINKFRGDPALLEPGVDMVQQITGRPVLGVLPFLDQLWIDAEDSLGTVVGTTLGRPAAALGSRGLTVAAIRLPRISNSTDVEALACEPGVVVRWVDHPTSLSGVDLVVLPGSKATVSDLSWLRRKGLAAAIGEHARNGKAVLGVCGGYQMLCRDIRDAVESGDGTPEPGLGLFDARIEFTAQKTVRAVDGFDHHSHTAVNGYEIHHGHVVDSNETPLLDLGVAGTEGARRGNVAGTHWHGLLANNNYRRHYLADLAQRSGLTGFHVSDTTDVAQVRTAQLDLLADALEEHCDVDAMVRLAQQGIQVAPAELRITRNPAGIRS